MSFNKKFPDEVHGTIALPANFRWIKISIS